VTSRAYIAKKVPESFNLPCAIRDNNGMVYVGSTGSDQPLRLFSLELDGSSLWQNPNNTFDRRDKLSAPSVNIEGVTYVGGVGKAYKIDQKGNGVEIPVRAAGTGGFHTYAIDQDSIRISYDGTTVDQATNEEEKFQYKANVTAVYSHFMFHEDFNYIVGFGKDPRIHKSKIFRIDGTFAKDVPAAWEPRFRFPSISTNVTTLDSAFFPDMFLQTVNATQGTQTIILVRGIPIVFKDFFAA